VEAIPESLERGRLPTKADEQPLVTEEEALPHMNTK
jgi:hypothetical protein